jgi:hypothetical protein
LAELRRRAQPSASGDEREAHFVAEQNAYVVKNAESYYQAMVRGGPESWNVRDRHMIQTLRKLLDHHGLPPWWWTYGSLAWNDWVWTLTERMACGCVRHFPGARRQRGRTKMSGNWAG